MHEGPWARRAARRRTLLQAVAAFALLAAAGGAVFLAAVAIPRWLHGEPTPEAAPSPTATTPRPAPGCATVTFPHSESLGLVAWVSARSLQVVDLGTCRVRSLASSGAAPPVRFSADGRWLAFGSGSLIPVEGGDVTRVPGGATSWAWAPTGARLAVVTPHGGIAVTEPGGATRTLLPDGSGAGHVAWSPDGTLLAFDRANTLGVVDVDSGAVRTVFSTSGPNPEVAAWSADSGWVLFWGAALGPDRAAGRGLDAVPATGGPWRNVWDSMLPFPDFVSTCGRSVVLAAGGRRLVSQGKQILLTGPPSWRFRNLTHDYLRSWAWPACSPDGHWLAATAMPNRSEPRFPSGVRSLRLIATDGSGRSRIDAPQLGALETARWSADGRSILVVERTKDDWGAPGKLLLVQVNPATGREVQRADVEVDLGPAPGPGGHQRWSEITDWYRPPP